MITRSPLASLKLGLLSSLMNSQGSIFACDGQERRRLANFHVETIGTGKRLDQFVNECGDIMEAHPKSLSMFQKRRQMLV